MKTLVNPFPKTALLLVFMLLTFNLLRANAGDDREEAGYPRVVDLSPSGFEQLGALSQGVVDVIISW